MAAEEDNLDQLEEYVDPAETEQSESGKTGVQGSYAGAQACSFRDMLLKDELQRAIGDAGFEHPSEVQQNAIPFAMVGNDMIVQAKSGMGKTAVFVIATLQQIEVEADAEKHVDTLVLCHSREVAYQISREFKRFSKYMPDVSVGVVYGGVNIKVHKKMMEEELPSILVGTPGRVLHLLNEKALKLDNLKRFVLDECDNLLEVALDIRRQVQEVFKKTPREKQVMFYSATISEDARNICRKMSQNAEEIFIDDNALTLHGLQQHFVKLEEKEKIKKLTDLLDALEFNQVMVFVRTRQRAAALTAMLKKCAFPAMCIHPKLSQNKRLERFKSFKDNSCPILVTTSLFGRGVDLERVNIVINFDMSGNSNEYFHRVGRAGRFGTKGLAITMIANEKDTEVLEQVQSRFEVRITELPTSIESSSYMAN